MSSISNASTYMVTNCVRLLIGKMEVALCLIGKVMSLN